MKLQRVILPNQKLIQFRKPEEPADAVRAFRGAVLRLPGNHAPRVFHRTGPPRIRVPVSGAVPRGLADGAGGSAGHSPPGTASAFGDGSGGGAMRAAKRAVKEAVKTTLFFVLFYTGIDPLKKHYWRNSAANIL